MLQPGLASLAAVAWLCSVFHSHAANLFFVLSSIHRLPQMMQNNSTCFFSENTRSNITRPLHLLQYTRLTNRGRRLVRNCVNADSTSSNNKNLEPFSSANTISYNRYDERKNCGKNCKNSLCVT